MLSNKTYDILKHVAAIGLPAISALYYTLAQIWGISHPGQIMASISAVNIFIGALVGVSGVQYNASGAKYDGVVEVTDTANKQIYALNLNDDPENIAHMKDLTLKVVPAPTEPQNPPSIGA